MYHERKKVDPLVLDRRRGDEKLRSTFLPNRVLTLWGLLSVGGTLAVVSNASVFSSKERPENPLDAPQQGTRSTDDRGLQSRNIPASPVSGASEAVRYWPQWRGPLGTGVAPHADPPVEWSEEKNIRWKIALPGSGHSAPVVWGDRVFLTAAVPSGKPPPVAVPARTAICRWCVANPS